jgi:3-methyl-2-oxobutanoate hydroxymethyltransferase
MHDLLGLNDWSPSFAKRYANLGSLAVQAARNFAEDVANAKFPDEEYSYR